MDSRDLHPQGIPEDLTLNDIESISEFVAECVLGVEDVFAEHDERDLEQTYDLGLKVLICDVVEIPACASSFRLPVRYFITNTRPSSEGVRTITSPPPQLLSLS